MSIIDRMKALKESECPVDVLKKEVSVHKCKNCGKCKDVCEEDAVVVAGIEKPRCPKKPIPCKRR